MLEVFSQPQKILGRTIYFKDRAQCYRCDDIDPLEICPNINNPAACPMEDYAITIQSITYTNVGSVMAYAINGEDEFTEAELKGKVTFRPKRSKSG